MQLYTRIAAAHSHCSCAISYSTAHSYLDCALILVLCTRIGTALILGLCTHVSIHALEPYVHTRLRTCIVTFARCCYCSLLLCALCCYVLIAVRHLLYNAWQSWLLGTCCCCAHIAAISSRSPVAAMSCTLRCYHAPALLSCALIAAKYSHC